MTFHRRKKSEIAALYFFYFSFIR